MADSPMSASPYQVLGVAASASDEDLRRAYRRLLRETHPDVGGDPARFIAVQTAWDSPTPSRDSGANRTAANGG